MSGIGTSVMFDPVQLRRTVCKPSLLRSWSTNPTFAESQSRKTSCIMNQICYRVSQATKFSPSNSMGSRPYSSASSRAENNSFITKPRDAKKSFMAWGLSPHEKGSCRQTKSQSVQFRHPPFGHETEQNPKMLNGKFP